MEAAIGEVCKFNDSYRETDWKRLIGLSVNTIEIIVYYWDKWVLEHKEELLNFFQKENAHLKIYLADLDKPHILGQVLTLFPEKSELELKSHVKNTEKHLSEIWESTSGSKLTIYKTNMLLNYACQCFDRRFCAFSFFEMHRKDKVDAPSFVVDLTQAVNSLQFVEKEFAGIEKNAKKIIFQR